MKLGFGFPVLNNHAGCIDAINSIQTKAESIKIRVHRQDVDRVPLAAAWNKLAMELFADGCDYAFICNDDILFSPECIDSMVWEYQRLRKSDNVIMVTPNNIMLETHWIPTPQDILDFRYPEDTAFSWSEHPNFSCFMISPEFFELHGTFDENFDPAWWEDNDSHYRANLLGYKEITTTTAAMVHFGGVTTAAIEHPDSSASHAYYVRKWGSANRNGHEDFKTPYNEPMLSPKEWQRGR